MSLCFECIYCSFLDHLLLRSLNDLAWSAAYCECISTPASNVAVYWLLMTKSYQKPTSYQTPVFKMDGTFVQKMAEPAWLTLAKEANLDQFLSGITWEMQKMPALRNMYLYHFVPDSGWNSAKKSTWNVKWSCRVVHQPPVSNSSSINEALLIHGHDVLFPPTSPGKSSKPCHWSNWFI